MPVISYDFSERPNCRVHFDTTAGPFPLAKKYGGDYILMLKDALKSL
jgi:hypothetical protein